ERQRMVGRALEIGRAPREEPAVGNGRERVLEGGEQPGFAEPRLRHEESDVPGASFHVVEAIDEERELDISADERRKGLWRDRISAFDPGVDTEHLEPRPLARGHLDGEALTGEAPADQPLRAAADRHTAVLGLLLDLERDVADLSDDRL